MKKWVIVVLISLLIGCVSAPRGTDILVRYPVGGEIVWVWEDGKRVSYYIVDEKKLKEYFEEKEKD